MLPRNAKCDKYLRVESLIELGPNFDHVVIAVNPNAGRRSGRLRVAELSERLSGNGLNVEVVTDLTEVSARADELHTQGRLRALVAAGGDGTIAEIVNRTSAGVPVTPLPLGTENLLSKHLGVAAGPEPVSQAIVEGLVARLDCGRAGERLFLLMASCGFDADVVQRLHDARRGHIRHWSYAKPILSAIRRYEYAELRITCESAPEGDTAGPLVTQTVTSTARWAFVFNLPCYAFGLRIARTANGADGLLDLRTFRRGSLWHGLRYLGGVLSGRHEGRADCWAGRITKVRIEADADVPYQLDGDPGGRLPLEIGVAPARLNLVVPRKWAERELG